MIPAATSPKIPKVVGVERLKFNVMQHITTTAYRWHSDSAGLQSEKSPCNELKRRSSDSLLFAKNRAVAARACRAEWQGPGPPERALRAPRLGQVGQGTDPRQAAGKLMDHVPCS